METGLFFHAIHLFNGRQSHMGWDSAEINYFAAGVKAG